MITALFEGFIKFALKIFSLFMGYIVTPLIQVISSTLPNTSDYLSSFNSFFVRICNGVTFAKEVFLNTTGFPRLLFYLLVYFFFTRVAFMGVIRGFRFLMNSYYLLRGNHFLKTSRGS